LARSLAEITKTKPFCQIDFVGRPDVDLEISGSVGEIIRAARPDVVINAAAYTEVDRAETESKRAFRINAEAAGEMAAAAAEIGAPLVHISTDYVFDGNAERAYREDDPTGPINVYGASKLAGEEAVRDANPRHLILRTSWVYGPFQPNFVATMLRLATERDQIRVVADQTGSPTSSLHLASLVLATIEDGLAGTGDTFHVAGAGEGTWADLAREVMSISAEVGGPQAEIIPITTQQWPTPARRPRFSPLDCSRFEAHFGVLPAWQEPVRVAVERLLG
jgi:dTDP-4-dehydrorhamnose reductase